MAANALGQTRIDAEVKDRAAAVLENMGSPSRTLCAFS